MPPCLEAEGNGQRELIVLDNHGVQRTCRFSAVSKHDTYANTSVDKSQNHRPKGRYNVNGRPENDVKP